MVLWLQPEAINPICGMKQDVFRDYRCLFFCQFVCFYGVLKHLKVQAGHAQHSSQRNPCDGPERKACAHRRQSTACLNATQVIRLRPPMTVAYVKSEPSFSVSRGTMQRRNVLTGPHDLVCRCQLQHLPHHCFLPTARHGRKHFANIEIHVLVHRGKVSRFTHIRITSVQQHERCLGVCRNQRLQMGRARTCKRDIRVAKTCVELHCKGGGDEAASETGNRAVRIGDDKEKKMTEPYQVYRTLRLS